jgi:superfamily II DNA or RNA helicase
LLPDDTAILRTVSRRTSFEAGQRLAELGRVRSIMVSTDSRRISAVVIDLPSGSYSSSIELFDPRSPGNVFHGRCTCGTRQNCKHVVAVLLALRQRQEQAAAPTGPAPPPRRCAASPPDQPNLPALLPDPPPVDPALPADLAAWLGTLDSEEDAATDPAAPQGHQRMFYVLTRAETPHGAPMLSLACVLARLRKDGTPGVGYPLQGYRPEAPPQHLRTADRVILARVTRRGPGTGLIAADEEPADLLRRVLATGRARWDTLEGPTLVEGPLRPGRIAWAVQEDGSQRATLELALSMDDPGRALGQAPIAVGLPEPWYVDPAAGLAGPVETGLPARLAGRLLAAPSVPLALAPKVAAELTRRAKAMSLPVPAELPKPETLRGPVQPHLRLMLAPLPSDLTAHHRRFAFLPDRPREVPVARLAFGYGPVTVAASDRTSATIVVREGRPYRVQRDTAGERAAVERLEEIGFLPARDVAQQLLGYAGAAAFARRSDDFLLGTEPDEADWLNILLDDIPDLRAEGWTVEIAADFPIRLVEPEGGITGRIDEGSGIDWFELQLGVIVEGQTVDLVPALVRLIASGEATELIAAEAEETEDDAPVLLPLPDGRLLTLPARQVVPILAALVELFAGRTAAEGEGAGGRFGFMRAEAADLAWLEERSGLVVQGGEALRQLGRQLREAGGAIPPAQLPESFAGTLRPYQAQGVTWLQFLRGAGLGGVLADDMGLGKTVQTLAHLVVEQAAGRLDRPALVVCPTSLVPNWLREAERFAASLSVLSLHGPSRKQRFADIPRHDLVITTYPLLGRDHAVLTAQDWHVVVLDEAQTIKNPNAETTRQALRLKARQRLCLSGTPLQNHLGELWSLFDFLSPGFLGSPSAFRSRYRTPIEKHGDTERQAILARRVRPFLLRRTKEEVAQELPPKTEILEAVELEPPQRAVYEAIRVAMHTKVQAAIAERGLARSGIIILDALLKMRQACCDPRLLKMASAKKAGSAKLDRLLELLEVLLGEGRRVLVFSQFTSMLALIEARLKQAGTPYVLLTGDTVDRSTPVRRFQAGAAPVFLISLKAGGVGLNLTAADTVIHYDPWWNPAVEDQATDRAHRIGQERHVFVHRLVALGTIEEKMQVLKDRKRALVAAVLDAGHGSALQLTEADVEELFAPA